MKRKILSVFLALILCLGLTLTVSAASSYSYDSFNFGKNLLIALGIGIVIGLIVVLVLKAQLKSVRMQNQADAYVRPGSMHLTTRSDIFLYRNVTRVRRASNNSKK